MALPPDSSSRAPGDGPAIPPYGGDRIGIIPGQSRSAKMADSHPPLAPCAAADAVLREAARLWGFDPERFRGRPRGRSPVGVARQAAIAGYGRRFGCGSSAVAEAFGVDDSTVRAADKRDPARHGADAAQYGARRTALDAFLAGVERGAPAGVPS